MYGTSIIKLIFKLTNYLFYSIYSLYFKVFIIKLTELVQISKIINKLILYN